MGARRPFADVGRGHDRVQTHLIQFRLQFVALDAGFHRRFGGLRRGGIGGCQPLAQHVALGAKFLQIVAGIRRRGR